MRPRSDDVEDETIEDSGDDDHGVVDSGKLLDRLFDEGLLPKYAFPTDVATFSVFEEGTDPWNPKRRYSPQQSLNAALSQYAPGHEVWVDGQRYLSLGLYAEREDERFDAYRDKRLYYQCRVCNYADLKQWDEGYPEQTRDCPACSGARRSDPRGAGCGRRASRIRRASPRCRPTLMQVLAFDQRGPRSIRCSSRMPPGSAAKRGRSVPAGRAGATAKLSSSPTADR